MATRFSEAYAEVLAGLTSSSFSKDKEWSKIVTRARKLAGADGFDVSEASLTEDVRKVISKAEGNGSKEALCFFDCAGEKVNGPVLTGVVGADLAKRLGALKLIRHTYLLKRFGAHKVWIVSLPTCFTDWPHAALRGGKSAAATKLNDKTEVFSEEARKHLSHASQEGLKWVHKAMSVAANPKKSKNLELVARWFADNDTKDADVVRMAGTLNAGLKKIAARLKSGTLIYTDSVSERGTPENQFTEAFVWGDPLDVVYIEQEFFGNQNTLTGLTNWARIVVHELTHREVQTKDHAYEHQGMSPKKIGADKAIENADSWAWFCADCAGMLTPGVIGNALAK
jgi:hypothetical protein